jgi:hypothetical protein
VQLCWIFPGRLEALSGRDASELCNELWRQDALCRVRPCTDAAVSAHVRRWRHWLAARDALLQLRAARQGPDAREAAQLLVLETSARVASGLLRARMAQMEEGREGLMADLRQAAAWAPQVHREVLASWLRQPLGLREVLLDAAAGGLCWFLARWPGASTTTALLDRLSPAGLGGGGPLHLALHNPHLVTVDMRLGGDPRHIRLRLTQLGAARGSHASPPAPPICPPLLQAELLGYLAAVYRALRDRKRWMWSPAGAQFDGFFIPPYTWAREMGIDPRTLFRGVPDVFDPWPSVLPATLGALMLTLRAEQPDDTWATCPPGARLVGR